MIHVINAVDEKSSVYKGCVVIDVSDVWLH